ncbi:alpha/beta fold hydrolase [Nonomuraea wenchangensis]
MALLRHIVVIIPGILGSVLRDERGEYAWGGLVEGLSRLLRPAALDIDTPLVPVTLMPTIKVIGTTLVPGYDGLVKRIRNAFPNAKVDTLVHGRASDPSANVLLFPYDFRAGVADVAEDLARKVRDHLGPPEEDNLRRVIVIGHSMGGLVARYWLGPLGGAPYCASLITAGTPHRGAPKALDWLWNGVGARNVRDARLTRIMRRWPSAYDLLPRYRTVLAGKLTPGLEPGTDPAALYPADLPWPEPAQAEHARRAYAMHEEIRAAWEELGECAPDLQPLFSSGHATLGRSTLKDGRVTVEKINAEWLPEPRRGGDGTVPWFSAVPLELDGQRSRWRPVRDRHLPMMSSSMIIRALAILSGVSTAKTRGDAPEGPWLGLDLDEIVPAGAAVPLRARWQGGPVDERTVVEARVAGSTVPGVAAEAGVWTFVLPPLPAGEHRVDVIAQPPGRDPVTCADVVGAVGEEI